MGIKKRSSRGSSSFYVYGGVYDLRRVPVRCEFDMATALFAFLGIRIEALAAID